MDWSSIYDEHGEEEGDWSGLHSRLDPFLDKLVLTGKYGPKVCYALTVNYILGVGCLGVPYAFQQSGIILGITLIVFISIVSLMTVLWVAEAGHRSFLIRLKIAHSNTTSQKSSVKNEKKPTRTFHNYLSTGPVQELSMSQMELDPTYAVSRTDTMLSEVELNEQAQMLHEESEVTHLVSEYLGPFWHNLYQISLMLLTYVGLLAYSQVFVRSFTTQIWPDAPPVVPVFFFGMIVIPLSCIDLTEQITVQLMMSALRFLSLAILFFGIIAALFYDYTDSHRHMTNPTESHPVPPYISTEISLFNFTGFGVMFTTSIFSQLFQHSVPGLIRPLSLKRKRNVPLVFGGALFTTCMIYITTGTCSVLYFGNNIKESINLNFVDFYWGIKSDWKLLLAALSMVVVLFPALDTLSVFPLIANTLSGNLYAYFPAVNKKLKHTIRHITGTSRPTKDLIILFWRLLAAFPPVLLSIFVTDLSLSLQIAGICGIIVALVTPAMLQRYSLLKINEKYPSLATQGTPYSSIFSSYHFTTLVLGIAFLAFFVCLLQLIQT